MRQAEPILLLASFVTATIVTSRWWTRFRPRTGPYFAAAVMLLSCLGFFGDWLEWGGPNGDGQIP